MRHEEHNEQVAFFEYCKWHHPDWFQVKATCKGVKQTAALIFAIPNGGARNEVTGAMLKAEGVQAGVPDIFCAIPKGKYHGLFIEMKKREGGRVRQTQREQMEFLSSRGYKCAVCNGYNEAVAALEEYLSLR